MRSPQIRKMLIIHEHWPLRMKMIQQYATTGLQYTNLCQSHRCWHGCCRVLCYWGSSWPHTFHHCYTWPTCSRWGVAQLGQQTSAPQRSSSHRPAIYIQSCLIAIYRVFFLKFSKLYFKMFNIDNISGKNFQKAWNSLIINITCGDTCA